MPPKRRGHTHFADSIRIDWKRIRVFILPLAVAAVVRAAGSIWLYHLLSATGSFQTPWMAANPGLAHLWSPIPIPSTSSNWLWLFNAWDSPHFLLIAFSGYAHPDYVFLPGYPLLIRLSGILTGNYWFGAFLVTQFLAFLSIVFFQLVAEMYMPTREALFSTLLMATFPYVSVFTTLSYSEGLFLFSSVAAWYYHKKARHGISSLLVGLASVSRIYGFAIVLPMLLDIVKSKNYRKLLYILIPVAAIGSWFLYCYFSTGNPLVSWSDERLWVYDSKYSLIQTLVSQIIGGIGVCCTIDSALLVSVGFFTYLIVMTWYIDRLLLVYAASVFLVVLFTATNHLSLIRFFSFIFPVWLTLRMRSPILAAICVALFIPVGILLWYYAIAITFVG